MQYSMEISQLSKAFREFTLDRVSFSLPQGYIMGFIGPNGAGKSTTIKCIMNLLHKDGGQIKLFGKDHIHYEREVKQQIGFVYDENYYYEELTIRQMARIVAPFYRGWDERAFQNYLKKFNVNPRLKIKELSKGMKMKFSLAVALSHHARLLIMDEPTSGLDPVVRSEFLDILAWVIEDESKSIFFSSHITSDLDKIADYITFINEGKMVFSASKEQILEDYVIVKGDKALLTAENCQVFVGLHQGNYGFDGLINDKALLPLSWRERVLLEKPTLEDIMLYTIKGVKSC